ncbi:MAG TPA: phasin family protein [Janthinobacterium sp.]|nr:phasin family protein [Janthinobacterium sp.]
MVKKQTTPATDEEKLASAVRTSAQQIWQGGLGAFVKAQEEGGRVFSKLVREGNELQQRTRSLAEVLAKPSSGTAAKAAPASAGKKPALKKKVN